MTLQRQIRITAGGNTIDYGRIAIDVPKTLDADPPEGKVIFTNLALTTEARFEEKQTVRVEAGQMHLQQVYTGLILRVEKKIEKPDTSLTLNLTPYIVDKETPVLFSFPPDTTLFVIVTSIIVEMGLPPGDLDALPLNERLPNGWGWNEVAASGLRDVLSPYGLTWYIDEGRVHIAAATQPNNTLQRLLVNADTGMVGSPEKTDTGVNVKVLLDTPVNLNQLVDVESSSYVYGYEEGSPRRDTRGVQTYKTYGMHYRGDNWSSSLTNTLRLESLTPRS